MKKAKIMLTSIAIMGVVGGALAFKAHNTFNGNLKCITVAGGQCTVSTYSTVASGGEILTCTALNAPASECTEALRVAFNQ
jgi:hypothetical protein